MWVDWETPVGDWETQERECCTYTDCSRERREKERRKCLCGGHHITSLFCVRGKKKVLTQSCKGILLLHRYEVTLKESKSESNAGIIQQLSSQKGEGAEHYPHLKREAISGHQHSSRPSSHLLPIRHPQDSASRRNGTPGTPAVVRHPK